MLKSLKRFGFDQDELSIVYKSYVRPVVEYMLMWFGIVGLHVNSLVILNVYREEHAEQS